MLKLNKHTLAYLLALGILVTQCTLIFAQYSHKFHKPDCKCKICLVVDHLAHALTNTSLTLKLGRYIPLQYNESVVFYTVLLSAVYSIRGPPLS